jgi:hypothetical protein
LTTSGTTAPRARSESIDSIDGAGEENESHGSNEEDLQHKGPGSKGKTFEHLNDSKWRDFCDKKLKRFETKWSKRLETYTEEDHYQMQHENDETADLEDVEIVIDTGADEDDIVLGSSGEDYQ